LDSGVGQFKLEGICVQRNVKACTNCLIGYQEARALDTTIAVNDPYDRASEGMIHSGAPG
jgi:hypothetical protein